MRGLVRAGRNIELRQDIALPRPASGQVLIRVSAFSLDADDYSLSSIPDGRIVGKGVAGRVIAVGEDVPAWRLGDDVIVDPGLGSKPGTASLLGVDRNGGAAEYVIASAIDACPVAVGLHLVSLPLLAFHYSLAERVLTWSRLYPHETIMILGADTPTGGASVALALLRGAKVWVDAAPVTIDPVPVAGIVANAASYAGGPLDVVADFRAQPNHADWFGHLPPSGVYVSRLGDVVNPPSRSLSALDDPDIFTMETLEHLAGMASRGELNPQPMAIFSLDDCASMLPELKAAASRGAVVVTA